MECALEEGNVFLGSSVLLQDRPQDVTGEGKENLERKKNKCKEKVSIA
jgi:hypothetical protein